MSPRCQQWTQLSQHNRLFEFIDSLLRGYAQVMLQNNPLTGLLFFIAIAIGSYQLHRPLIILSCFIATAVATLTGYLIKADRQWRRDGLAGYNGCLLGIALPLFLNNNPALWGCLILLSVISVILTLCLAQILQKWQVAPLTVPFVLLTWLLLLSSAVLTQLSPLSAQPTGVTFSATQSLFNGISQVFLFSSVTVGAIFLLGLAVESRQSALFALLGSAIAIAISLILGGDQQTAYAGLYSYSAVLTAIAVGCVFNPPGWCSALYALLAVIFTVMLQAALVPLLAPYALPVLTMPFNLASWIVLIPQRLILGQPRG